MMLNPILEREIKSKMRSWKMPIAVMVYLFFIGLISYTGMMATSIGYSNRFDPHAATGIFDFISIFQLALIMFIVPLVTASSISGERERQTLDLMLCSDYPIMGIIYGKILSGLSTILFLVIMATPFLSVSFALGGIGLFDVLKIVLYYVATALYISTIAIYASARFKKSITAIIMSYVIMGILYITPFIFMFGFSFNYHQSSAFLELIEMEPYLSTAILFGANPGYGMISLTSIESFLGLTKSSNFPFLELIPTWAISLIWFALISFLMLKLTKKRLTAKE